MVLVNISWSQLLQGVFSFIIFRNLAPMYFECMCALNKLKLTGFYTSEVALIHKHQTKSTEFISLIIHSSLGVACALFSIQLYTGGYSLPVELSLTAGMPGS